MVRTNSATAVTFSFMVLILLALDLACDKGVEPLNLKNPRDFSWTVDTIAAHPDAWQTMMAEIYATNSLNVYIAGHSDWAGVNGVGILWRYDGTKWTAVDWGFDGAFVSLWSITGFDENNIYAVGSYGNSALILHFDGTRWNKQILPGQDLFRIRGDAPSNIWVGGWMGSAFRFDGTNWSKISTDNRLSIRSLAVTNGNTFCVAYRLDDQPADTTSWYFLKWNYTQWDTVDSFAEVAGERVNRTFGASLSVVNGELYSGGGALFKLISGKWEKIFDGPNIGPVSGPSPKNLFAVGYGGSVYHYNGNDWFQFDQFVSSEFHFSSVWFNGTEVFITGDNGRKSIILHGK